MARILAFRAASAHECAIVLSKFPAIRGPQVPLDELVDILGEVATTLEGIEYVAEVDALDSRIGQCSAAIVACRRDDFSMPLRRALASKVLELESDVLVLAKARARQSRAKKRTGTKKRQLSSRP